MRRAPDRRLLVLAEEHVVKESAERLEKENTDYDDADYRVAVACSQLQQERVRLARSSKRCNEESSYLVSGDSNPDTHAQAG